MKTHLKNYETVKHIKLLRLLKDNECLQLVNESYIFNFAKHDIIFSESEKANGFHIIISGLAKVFHNSPDGRELVLHLVRPGGTLGEAAVFQHGTYPASAEAIEDTQTVFLSTTLAMQIIRQNPDFAEAMLGALSLRIRMFTRKLQAQGMREAPERLAAYLIHRIQLGKNEDTLHFESSREVLAHMLGTARETLSRAMAYLVRKKIISVKGREVKILDLAILKEIAAGKNCK